MLVVDDVVFVEPFEEVNAELVVLCLPEEVVAEVDLVEMVVVVVTVGSSEVVDAESLVVLMIIVVVPTASDIVVVDVMSFDVKTLVAVEKNVLALIVEFEDLWWCFPSLLSSDLSHLSPSSLLLSLLLLLLPLLSEDP